MQHGSSLLWGPNEFEGDKCMQKAKNIYLVITNTICTNKYKHLQQQRTTVHID